MNNPAGMTPDELMDEMKVTDKRVEELRGYRAQMLAQIDSATGLSRTYHNVNFVLSEKQIARHLRIQKIHRDRVGQHYQLATGDEPPVAEWHKRTDRPGRNKEKAEKKARKGWKIWKSRRKS